MMVKNILSLCLLIVYISFALAPPVPYQPKRNSVIEQLTKKFHKEDALAYRDSWRGAAKAPTIIRGVLWFCIN